uniref:Uncharacterized protein n=1 Tax=Anopheles darlingi TaxID=43151 RepID=A0A2M4D3V2_ANODA
MYGACMSTAFFFSSFLPLPLTLCLDLSLSLSLSFTLFICRFQSLSLCWYKLTPLFEIRSIRRSRSC